MRSRRILFTTVLASLTFGGAVGTTAAQAASSPSGPATAGQTAAGPGRATASLCRHPCSKPPGKGWRYIDNYYWASSCIAVGNRGIQQRVWLRYQCKGSAWTNYDLWVN